MPGASTWLSSRRLVPAAVCLLLVTSLLPSRHAGAVGALGEVVRVALAPVSHPLRTLGGWLRPASPDAPPEAIALLEEELDRTRTLYLRVERENAQLRARIAELERGVAHGGGPVSQVRADVLGAASDLSSRLLTIRAGRDRGVAAGAVAVVDAVQLVGRVVEVGPKTAELRPISARDAGALRGVVMTGEASGPACLLRPTGEGTLRGDVQDAADVGGAELAVGQVVRLDDPTWPAHAQMLIVGRVVSVESPVDAPLRRVVVVRPTVDLPRVTEVTLRSADEGRGP